MKIYFFFLLFIIVSISQAQTAANKTDDKGLKQGYWVKLNPKTGKPFYKGTFKDDKPVGVFKYYYEEIDTIKTIMEFKNNGTVGYATMFYMTGAKQAKGKYVNEQKDSVWTIYDESGKILSSESYKAGKRHGKSIVYLQNGDIAEERSFKNDINDGPYKMYFEGKKLKDKGNYVAGKLVGKNAYYYPSGTIAAIGYYNNNGNKNGVWLYKNNEGKVTSKDVYDDGKLLNEKEAAEWLQKNKGKEPKEEPTKNPKGKKTDTTKSSKGTTKSGTPAKSTKK
ncbi:MAG: hypothetical protein IPG89_16145 [Bacteroidetes bacterium]|nr:hypothetical protein [Bacteroidota bacterium]